MATRTNKVEVEITAVDEASPKIDKLTKKIDGLEADEARITVTSNIDRLDKQLTDALALMAKLDGDELTVQMRAVGNLEDDLIAARKLLEQLDGQTGTVKLQADTSDLEANVTRAKSEIDDIPRSAGGANNALANMVGNSAQDLGELGGVVGSLGVGIGQMAEYAADAALDGERLGSALGSMAKVAGPIALLTLAVLGVKSAMAGLTEANDLGTESQERWTKALEDGGDAATNWIEQMRETREIVVDMTDLDDSLDDLSRTVEGFSWKHFFNPLDGGRKQTEDITELFEKAGISIEQLGRAITGNEDVQRRFREGVEQSTLSADEQTLVLSLLTQETERYNKAQEASTRFQTVFDPEPILLSAEALAKYNTQQDRYVEGLTQRGDEVDRQQRVTEQYELARDKLASLNTEAERVDRARIAARERDAVENVRREYQKLRDDLADRKSLLTLQGSFDDLRQSAVDAWNAAASGAEDAEDKQRSYQIAQIDTTQEVLDYIDALGGIPDSQTTQIIAAMERGDIDAVEATLNQLTAARTVPVKVALTLTPLQRRIFGIEVIPGLPSPQSMPLPPDGGGGTIVNVNMPRGSRGVDVMRTITGQTRRTGRKYGVAQVHYARR